MSMSDVVELSGNVFFCFSFFEDVKQLDRSAMFYLKCFFKRVVGKITVYRTANRNFSTPSEFFFLVRV